MQWTSELARRFPYINTRHGAKRAWFHLSWFISSWAMASGFMASGLPDSGDCPPECISLYKATSTVRADPLHLASSVLCCSIPGPMDNSNDTSFRERQGHLCRPRGYHQATNDITDADSQEYPDWLRGQQPVSSHLFPGPEVGSEVSLMSGGFSGVHREPASRDRNDPGFGRRGLELAHPPYHPYPYDPNYLADHEATFNDSSTEPCRLVPAQTLDYSWEYPDRSASSAESFSAKGSGLVSNSTFQNYSTPRNRSFVDRVAAGCDGRGLHRFPSGPSPEHPTNEGMLSGANGDVLGSQDSGFYSNSSPTAQVGNSRHQLQFGEGNILQAANLTSQDESLDGPMLQFSHNLQPPNLRLPPLSPTRASRSIRTAFPPPASGSSTRSHRMRPEYRSPERDGRNRTTVDPGARYRKKIEVGLEELAEALETVGMGIHGEKGSMKILVLRKAKEVVLSFGSLNHTQRDQPPG